MIEGKINEKLCLRYIILFVFSIFLLNNSLVFATPIYSRFGANVIVMDSAPVESYNLFSETNYVEHSNFDSTMQTYANLNTGKVGARAIDDSHTLITMFDTLTFDIGGAASANISFNTIYDGFFLSFNRFAHPFAHFGLHIYDITGIDQWLSEEDFFGFFNDVEAVDEAVEVYSGGFYLNFDDLGGVNNGSVLDVERMLSGSFTVEADHTYGIQMTNNVYAGRNSYTDFYHTGTFEFANLNDATYTSGSGVFLSAFNSGATPTPEPTTILLFAIGLLGLARVNRKQANA